MDIIYVILGVLLIVIFIILGKYNQLIKLKNRVKQSASGIDIYLNQRFDLIPNLVECVKGYTKYEEETLEKIVELRSDYNKTNGLNIKQATQINNDLNKILAVAENYPELKASEQFLNLQKNLEKIESQLQAARRIYNNDVTNYNTKIESVPSNIVASMFAFKKAELFQIEEYKKDNIKVDL